jgi:hypothetical protein
MRNLNLPPDDPNVKIPAAVKARALQGEEAFKLAHGEAPPEGGEPEAPPADQNLAPQDAAPAPAASEETPPQPQTKTEPAPQHKVDDWEQKFRSAQGRLDRANAQIGGLSEQLANLQNLVASLQSAPKEPAATEQSESYVTPEDRETYGEDFLNVVERKAKELVGPLKKELQERIRQLDAKLGNVGSSVQANARERMLSDLDNQVPSWREINTNDSFLQWLKLPDMYSGAIRHDLLRAAFEHNNTARVAAFFNGFLAEEAAVGPASGSGPDGGTGAQPSPNVPKVPLENLAAPGRAKTAASSPSPAEKPSFTRAQIAKFYADVTAGRFRGREADRDKLEAQIFVAQREGRIR